MLQKPSRSELRTDLRSFWRRDNENRSHEYFSNSLLDSRPAQSLDRLLPRIAVGNQTPDQHVTGDRMGLFRDGSSTSRAFCLLLTEADRSSNARRRR